MATFGCVWQMGRFWGAEFFSEQQKNRKLGVRAGCGECLVRGCFLREGLVWMIPVAVKAKPLGSRWSRVRSYGWSEGLARLVLIGEEKPPLGPRQCAVRSDTDLKFNDG